MTFSKGTGEGGLVPQDLQEVSLSVSENIVPPTRWLVGSKIRKNSAFHFRWIFVPEMFFDPQVLCMLLKFNFVRCTLDPPGLCESERRVVTVRRSN